MVGLATAAFCVGGVIGYILGVRFWIRMLVALFLGLVSVTLFLFFATPPWLNEVSATTAVMLLLVPPPMSAGLLVGGALTLLLRRRSGSVS